MDKDSREAFIKQMPAINDELFKMSIMGKRAYHEMNRDPILMDKLNEKYKHMSLTELITHLDKE